MKNYTFTYIINDKNNIKKETGILKAQALNKETAINIIKRNAIKLFNDYADKGNRLSFKIK